MIFYFGCLFMFFLYFCCYLLEFGRGVFVKIGFDEFWVDYVDDNISMGYG